MTKVVVLEKFKKNWEIGSVVSVKDGYARNYLIPNGKAKFATQQNIEEIKSLKRVSKKDDENKSLSIKTASKINELKFSKEIAAKENGELYGSISVSDIVSFLGDNNVTIQKKSVKLGNKIKTTGEYKVDIDLHPVNCSLDIEILSPKVLPKTFFSKFIFNLPLHAKTFDSLKDNDIEIIVIAYLLKHPDLIDTHFENLIIIYLLIQKI